MGVIDEFSLVQTLVYSKELVVLSIKFDPNKVSSWQKLLSIKSNLSFLSLLMSLKVHIRTARHIVHIVELHIGLRLFDLHRADGTIVGENVHQVLLSERVRDLFDVQVRELWSLRKIPFDSLLGF